MKFMKWSKDGGPESTVNGFFLIEIKDMFSIALLKFEGSSRQAFHSHAFNCLSWLIKGRLRETHFGGKVDIYKPSLIPFWVYRETFHRVDSEGTSWVLTIRGPWDDTWREYLPASNRYVELTHGRKETNSYRHG